MESDEGQNVRERLVRGINALLSQSKEGNHLSRGFIFAIELAVDYMIFKGVRKMDIKQNGYIISFQVEKIEEK